MFRNVAAAAIAAGRGIKAVRKKGLAVVLLIAAAAAACSVPNLESADCTAARNNVREFYSFHFGNGLEPSPDSLKARERFLTPELFRELSAPEPGGVDYFTATADYPKAFRVGACTEETPGRKVALQVLLFWRTDTRSEQREIRVEAVRSDDHWLISKVENE